MVIKINAEDVLQITIAKMKKEVDLLNKKPTLSLTEGRLLTEYAKTLLQIVKENRMAAEGLELEALQDAELAELTKKATATLKK